MSRRYNDTVAFGASRAKSQAAGQKPKKQKEKLDIKDRYKAFIGVLQKSNMIEPRAASSESSGSSGEELYDDSHIERDSTAREDGVQNIHRDSSHSRIRQESDQFELEDIDRLNQTCMSPANQFSQMYETSKTDLKKLSPNEEQLNTQPKYFEGQSTSKLSSAYHQADDQPLRERQQQYSSDSSSSSLANLGGTIGINPLDANKQEEKFETYSIPTFNKLRNTKSTHQDLTNTDLLEPPKSKISLRVKADELQVNQGNKTQKIDQYILEPIQSKDESNQYEELIKYQIHQCEEVQINYQFIEYESQAQISSKLSNLQQVPSFTICILKSKLVDDAELLTQNNARAYFENQIKKDAFGRQNKDKYTTISLKAKMRSTQSFVEVAEDEEINKFIHQKSKYNLESPLEPMQIKLQFIIQTENKDVEQSIYEIQQNLHNQKQEIENSKQISKAAAKGTHMVKQEVAELKAELLKQEQNFSEARLQLLEQKFEQQFEQIREQTDLVKKMESNVERLANELKELKNTTKAIYSYQKSSSQKNSSGNNSHEKQEELSFQNQDLNSNRQNFGQFQIQKLGQKSISQQPYSHQNNKQIASRNFNPQLSNIPSLLSSSLADGSRVSQLTKQSPEYHGALRQPLAKMSNNKNETKCLDMAFLYAQPIVKRNKMGQIMPVDMPLDLEAEYQDLVDGLQDVGKQFRIKKQPVNCQSLQDIINDKPKIIHISSHGAFNPENNEFYLAMEKKGTGEQDNLSEGRLQPIVNNIAFLNKNERNQFPIKLAFVSACQSEEIGQIFLNAGIPIVISVKTDLEQMNIDQNFGSILDSCCQLFSQNFYRNLLQGFTINQSFESARISIQINDKKFDTCCCAHKHAADCTWYKFYVQNPEEAHLLHAKQCGCNQHGVNGMRQHKGNCEAYIAFRNFMKQEKDQGAGLHKSDNLQDAMQGLGITDWGSDEDVLADDFMEGTIAKDEREDQLIMCCCQQDQKHDESMKFQIKVNEKYEQEGRKLLESTLFKGNPEGILIEEDEQQIIERMKFPLNIDSNMIFGRNVDIHETISFLTDNDKKKRLLVINGIHGCGQYAIALFAAKYVIQRSYFQDSAYHVDVSSKFTVSGLFRAICEKMKIFTNDIEELIVAIRKQKTLLIIDECDEVMNQDPKELESFLFRLTSQTDGMKILMIANQESNFEFKNEKLTSFAKIKHIDLLDKLDSAKMMYQLNSENSDPHFKSIKDLIKHDLFTLRFTPLQISQMSFMLKGGLSLKKLYEQNKELENEKDVKKKNEDRENRINMMIFQKIKEVNPNELNIIFILSFAQAGLSQYDLMRVTSIQNLKNSNQINFGKWEEFLRILIIQAQPDLIKNAAQQCDTTNNDDAQSLNKSADETIPHEGLSFKKAYSTISGVSNIKGNKKINKNQWNLGFQVLKNKFQVEMSLQIFILQTTFKNFIYRYINDLDQQKKIVYFQHYIQYMGLLSRQIVQTTFQTKLQYELVVDSRQLDPYLLNTQINEGIWNQPYQLRYLWCNDEMPITDQENLFISQNKSNIFSMHEGNFWEIVDFNKLQEIFGNIDTESEIYNYIEEICLNVPSIFIMFKQYRQAFDYIAKARQISKNFGLDLMTAKLLLIQSSIDIQYGNQLNRHEILSDLEWASGVFDALMDKQDGNGAYGRAECQFLKAVLSIKKHNSYLEQIKSSGEFQRTISQDPLFNSYGALGTKMFSESTKTIKSAALLHNKLNQIEGPNPHQTVMKKLEDEYNAALADLKICRDIIRNQEQFKVEDAPLLIHKTWLVEADLVFQNYTNTRNLEEQCRLNTEQQNELLTQLELAFDYFAYNDYNNMKTRCLMHQSRILLLQGKDLMCRSKLIEALNLSREQNNYKISLEATKLFQEVNLKIQINVNNIFIFAEALPLDKKTQKLRQVDEHTIQNQTDFKNDKPRIMNILQNTKKQLDIKFEVLNERMLKQIQINGCKVLHLTPFVDEITDSVDSFIMEDDQQCQTFLSAQQLSTLLKPEKGSLNVCLVIIEHVNCQSFVDVLRALGVEHVISFKTVADSKEFHQDVEINNQIKLRMITRFMREFSYYFYEFITAGQTFFRACDSAEMKAKKYQSHIKIEKAHYCDISKQKDKLYDDQGLDDTKKLQDGQLCDTSNKRALFETVSYSEPFIHRKTYAKLNLITQILTKDLADGKSCNIIKSFEDTLNNDVPLTSRDSLTYHSHQINVNGPKGVGKTRLVYEACSHLRYHHYFRAGIFFFDFQTLTNFSSVFEMIREYNSNGDNESDNDEQNQCMVDIEEENDCDQNHANQILLVFDNCDKIISQNSNSFLINLEQIGKQTTNATIIMISNEPIATKNPHCKYFGLQPFSTYESVLFMCAIDHQMGKHLKATMLSQNEPRQSTEQDQLDFLLLQANGNPLLLKVIMMIYTFGGEKLFSKIKLLTHQAKDNVRMTDMSRNMNLSQYQQTNGSRAIDTLYQINSIINTKERFKTLKNYDQQTFYQRSQQSKKGSVRNLNEDHYQNQQFPIKIPQAFQNRTQTFEKVNKKEPMKAKKDSLELEKYMKEIKVRQEEDGWDNEHCDLDNMSEASDKSNQLENIKQLQNQGANLKAVGFYETMSLGGTLKKGQMGNQLDQMKFGQSKVSGMNLELIEEGNEFIQSSINHSLSDEKLKSSYNMRLTNIQDHEGRTTSLFGQSEDVYKAHYQGIQITAEDFQMNKLPIQLLQKPSGIRILANDKWDARKLSPSKQSIFKTQQFQQYNNSGKMFMHDSSNRIDESISESSNYKSPTRENEKKEKINQPDANIDQISRINIYVPKGLVQRHLEVNLISSRPNKSQSTQKNAEFQKEDSNGSNDGISNKISQQHSAFALSQSQPFFGQTFNQYQTIEPNDEDQASPGDRHSVQGSHDGFNDSRKASLEADTDNHSFNDERKGEDELQEIPQTKKEPTVAINVSK